MTDHKSRWERTRRIEAGEWLAPGQSEQAMNLARLYVTQGQMEKAKDVLRGFLKVVPGHAGARRALEQL